MAKKKVTIDKGVCIGCGSCAATYPETFKIGDDGLAEPVTGEVETDDNVTEVCPTSAITVK